MKRTVATAAIAVCLSSPAAAALAPNYQRLAEITAILGDSRVVDAFSPMEPIDRIEYLKEDLYRVTAGKCHVDVAIVSKPMPQGMVGPRQFTVEPGGRICNQSD